MRNISKTSGLVLALGVLGGCVAVGNVVTETGRAVAEPFARVGMELKKGNLLAPLYAPRGAINGLERLGHALTGNDYAPKVGEDGSVSSAIPPYVLEGITAGVVFAPVVPLTFIEMGVIGGALGGAAGYYK